MSGTKISNIRNLWKSFSQSQVLKNEKVHKSLMTSSYLLECSRTYICPDICPGICPTDLAESCLSRYLSRYLSHLSRYLSHLETCSSSSWLSFSLRKLVHTHYPFSKSTFAKPVSFTQKKSIFRLSFAFASSNSSLECLHPTLSATAIAQE